MQLRLRLPSLALLLLGVMLLAACGAQQYTAEQIVQRMEATRAATNDAHATVAVDMNSDRQTGRLLIETWLKKTGRNDETGQPINKMRVLVKESDKAEQVGTLFVSNGDTFWLYNPSRKTVITGKRSDIPGGGIPTVPGTEALQGLITRGMSALNVEVLGTEDVAGTSTWKLKLTPKSDTQQQLQLDGLAQATMWVDEARSLPLKLDVDASSMGKGTIEARSIETNTGLSDDLFTFTPPSDATVTQAADMIARTRPQATTLDEARSHVSFKLLAPTVLPGNATLTEVQLVGEQTVIQNYSGGASFSVVQSAQDVGRDRQAPEGSQTQQVRVRGQDATLITGAGSEQGSLLRWQENGVRIVIAGTLSAEQAQQVADSLQ